MVDSESRIRSVFICDGHPSNRRPHLPGRFLQATRRGYAGGCRQRLKPKNTPETESAEEPGQRAVKQKYQMNSTDLIGFDGSFTAEEIDSIKEIIERIEPRFQDQPANSIMPPWFVVKDNLPGHSRVFIVHRFGKEQAVVAHTLEELTERLSAERPD